MKTSKRTCTVFVEGMHCQACEVLIEKNLKKQPSIQSVSASLDTKKVTLTFTKHTKKLNLNTLNEVLQPLGYRLTAEPVGKVRWNEKTLTTAIITLLLLGGIYYIAQSEGWLSYVTVTESSSYPAFFLFGIIAGFSSCAALVGGLLLSLSRQWSSMYGGSSLIKRSAPFAMFNIGRLIAYGILGGVLGAVGAVFQVSLSATALLVFGVSVLMIIVGLQMIGVPWVSRIRLRLPRAVSHKMSSAEQFQGKYMPFLAGAGTFFLPCGFTLLVQTIALTTGSALVSGAILFSFALGTLLPLIIISASSITLQNNPLFAGTFNLVVGILIVAFGAYNINSQLIVLGAPNLSTIRRTQSLPSADTVALDDEGLGAEIVTEDGIEKQKMYIKASGFSYSPESITLKADIPTILTVTNENSVGCAQAMYLQGLSNDILYLNKPEVTAQFIPQKGTYYISCSMGMVKPIIVTVI